MVSLKKIWRGGGGGRRRAKPKKVCYVEFVGEFSWRFLEFSKYVWNGRGGGGALTKGVNALVVYYVVCLEVE